MKQFFNVEESEWNVSKISIAILFTFIFSVSLRYIWVDQFKDVEAFKWLGQIMINTNDGYYFAEGARDILAGGHQENDGSPIHEPASQITALFAKILPFSFETIILWLPAFLGSLLVIPLILIGQTLKQPLMGVIGALVGSIAYSYYNRTMVGYYDTDMLSIVLPTFMLWGIIAYLKTTEDRFLIIAPIFLVLYLAWYGQGVSLALATIGFLFLYTLVFHRRDFGNYKLLSLLFVALTPLTPVIKIALILVIFAIFHYLENSKSFARKKEPKSEDTTIQTTVILKKEDDINDKLDQALLHKITISIFIASGIGLMFSGSFDYVYYLLKSYVFREESAVTNSFHFYNVAQTVREAGSIPFDVFAERISGHMLTFWIATIGTILLMFKYREMTIALPMIALGYLAYNSGLRFTIYAVPVYALGLGYIIAIIVKDFQSKYLKYSSAVILTALAIYPNYIHIQEYKVPVVFNNNEIAVLDQLKYTAKREDYAIAWWDYGYPIRFYSDVKTLVDGGGHSGEANYPVSFALMRKPMESANMSRIAVEFREQNKYSIEAMIKDLNFSTSNEFIKALETNITLPNKTKDIYYYLPLRMLDIFPTVALFSNIDLNTGNQMIKPFFYQTGSFTDRGGEIDLANGIVFDKTKAVIKISGREMPIDSFYITQYDNNGKLLTTRLQSRAGANISIIYMKNYNRILVVDNFTLNSAYFQLFILETYSRELFEPVILTPIAKVFKLKK